MHPFEERIRRFSAARRNVRNATLGYGLGALALVAGTAGLLLLSGWLPNAFVNAGLSLVLLLGWVALAVVFAVRRERFRSVLHEAFLMEDLAGGLNSRLISAWDFQEQGLDDPLVQAVVRRAAEDLQSDFESRIDRHKRDKRRKRFAVWLVLFLLIGCTPWFGFLRVAANLDRSWFAVREYLFPVEYEISPTPGQHIMRLGEKVDVVLQFHKRGYQQVTLVSRVGDKTQRIPLTVDARGAARYTVTSGVEAQHVLHFEFGERRAPEVSLVFTALPILVNMQTELIYPSYTRMLPRTLEGIQQRILGLGGTRITLGFTFSKELESAILTWDDGEVLPLDLMGRFASISVLHSRDRRASLQVKDKFGFGLEYPLLIDFAVQKDEEPQLFLPKHLTDDMPLLQDAVPLFGFGVRLQDDFGVTRCILKWQKSTVNSPNAILDRGEVERLVSPPQRKAVVNFEKTFAGLTLVPGDKVSFQVEVYDNRSPDSQVARSRHCSFFVYQEELGGLSIRELGFGAGMGGAPGRIAKARRATSVQEPAALHTREKFRNEFQAAIESATRAPAVRGEYGPATHDYFRLLSGVTYQDEKKKEGAGGTTLATPKE